MARPWRRLAMLCLIAGLVALLAACGGSRTRSSKGSTSRGNVGSPARRGGVNDDTSRSQSSRYGVDNDSVPNDNLDVSKLVEPTPRSEPRSLYGNKSPYSVLGKSYTVLPNASGYDERGIASFYGSKFHGYKTSNFENYDMYQFTAAHKTLPLPSYARVTNLENGKTVVVRINDRGPFHENRIIDLSYAAAVKIGVWPKGTGLVEVRAIDPDHPDAPGTLVSSSAASSSASRAVSSPAPTRPSSLIATGPAVAGVVSRPARAATTAPQASSRVAFQPPASTSPGDAASAAIVPPPMRPVTAPSAGDIASASIASALPPEPSGPPAVPTVNPKPKIYLQVGAFSDLANASRVADQLTRAGLGPVSVIQGDLNGHPVRRVRVGPLADVDTADRVTDQIAGLGLPRPSVAVD
ncbi:septal ring lytic transglycosylase RlpA family protein [Pinirhizobacter sp.]|uniref:septal ring lytic transglycosylase RlpA family protein n=1 Tax=Pinirhizobacter sp. TaxID=2950432 RepID=UPI002F41CA6B